MFENVLNTLNNIQKITYDIPISLDEEGYLDRECPNQECLFQFKIYGEDLQNRRKDELYCPRCGKSEQANCWYTTEQIEEGKRKAIQAVKSTIFEALEKDAKDFNKKQKGNFIKFNMSVSGYNKYECIFPISCKDIVQQKIKCDICNTRYAVIGSAFYCPICGNNSAKQTFEEFIKTTYSKLNNLMVIRNAIQDKDESNRVCRALLEGIPNDLVESIQCLSESVYDTFPNKRKLKKNVFQRIDDSNILWKELVGVSFEDWLTDSELKKMKIYYQKKHLLSHKNGIVDEEYIRKSNDNLYNIGERIIINENDALEFTQIIEKLGKQLIKIAN